MYGYMGKLLFVDLSSGSMEERPLDPELARNFIGGPSLGAAILYREMPAHTDVFAPESVLGFLGSPTNGTGPLMAGRWCVVSKSPVTGGINDASSGGLFAVMLRGSGYDGVFFKGIAPKPVYLYVENGTAELRDASDLWELSVRQTEAALREKLPGKKFDAAMVGPGGERMAWTAGVINDSHRIAARGGTGAVMGSKNLKALVCCGDQKPEVYDRNAVVEVNRQTAEWIRSGPTAEGPIRIWRDWGTNNGFPTNVLVGDAGVKNWTGSAEDLTMEQLEAVSAQATDPKWKKKKYACASCPIGCGAIYEIHEDGFDLDYGGKPEYETNGAFSSMLMCADALLVQKCNHWCNESGLDTISVGGTVAWAMECFSKGILSEDELDGIELSWGNTAAVEAIMRKICDGEGVGAVLANGSRYAADHFGKGRECLAVADGIELPQHDSRWSTAMARTYKYDPTPGRHTKGGLGPNFGGESWETRSNFAIHGEADKKSVADTENINLGGFCCFAAFTLPPTAVRDYINAVTGFNYSEAEFTDVGLRSYAIRAAFNMREGFVPRRDASLSDRMVGLPPLDAGPNAGMTVDVDMLGEKFYEAMHYDPATGNPTKEELQRLGGMDQVIADCF